MKNTLAKPAKRRIVQATTLLVAAVGLAAVISGTQTAAVAVPTDDIAATAASGKPKEGDVRGHRRILLVKYHVVKDCKVHVNYPKNPGSQNSWPIRKGAQIIWRYNVNGKVAAVSDPGKNTFPHWGFVEDSSCIGKTVGQKGHYEIYHNGKWVRKDTPSIPAGEPMPERTLSGRSQFKPYWAKVEWRPDHGAVPSAERKMTHNRTLRDAPHSFVIGNVRDNWTVRPTGTKKEGYTLVYVPSLHRWGWLQL